MEDENEKEKYRTEKWIDCVSLLSPGGARQAIGVSKQKKEKFTDGFRGESEICKI